MSYSVYIVDDEKNICNLIKNEIDWDRLGLELKGIYSNSEEALHNICLNAPDIVITDIQMPCLDGLELIKKAQEAGVESKFIIISGYSYFDYAKQAVQYGVNNYILKPIDHWELNDSLERLCHIINKSITRFDTLICNKINAMSLRDYYINNPAEHQFNSLEEVNNNFHFKFQSGLFFALSIRIDPQKPTKQTYITAARITGSLNRNIANSCFDFHIVAKDQLSYIGLINSGKEEILAMIRGLQYVIDEGNSEYLLGNDSALTIGLSEGFTSLSDSALYFKQAAQLCDCRLVLGGNKLYEWDKMPKNTFNFEGDISEFQNRLSGELVNISKESFLGICSDFLDDSLKKLRGDPLSLISFNKAIHITVSSILNSTANDIISVEMIYDSISYKNAVLDEIEKMFSSYENSFLSNECKSVIEIKAYIKTHLAEKLDLESLSKTFFFSSGYLGQLFKQETGINITAYINNERIDLAKKLLAQNELSIGVVAEQTGFNDAKYFTRMFKRTTGISPTEYRKIHSIF